MSEDTKPGRHRRHTIPPTSGGHGTREIPEGLEPPTDWGREETTDPGIRRKLQPLREKQDSFDKSIKHYVKQFRIVVGGAVAAMTAGVGLIAALKGQPQPVPQTSVPVQLVETVKDHEHRLLQLEKILPEIRASLKSIEKWVKPKGVE